jgi:FKBP-type peptidyl-prolyl cis-trans isomerase FklB
LFTFGSQKMKCSNNYKAQNTSFMTKSFRIFILLALIFNVGYAQKPVKVKGLKTFNDSVSYCLGISIAKSINDWGMQDITPGLISQGLNDALAKKAEPFTDDQAEALITKFVQIAKEKESEASLKEANDYMAVNGKKEGIVSLPSGLQYKILQDGTGAYPLATDNVTVHYKGMLTDSTQFDSSYDRGEPATFPLNRVIPGWIEALQLMKVGSKWIIFLPPGLAYGTNPPQGSPIKPNAVLVFEIELLGIEKAE